MAEVKPLKWTAEPGIGYTVVRRQDGGMHFTFTAVDSKTLTHWRDFALQHLFDSDEPTRNLYDLRRIEHIPDAAIDLAIEANSDPSTRNIRLAVVVATEAARVGVEKVAALSTRGVQMGIFTDLDEAEAWLSQPFSPLLQS